MNATQGRGITLRRWALLLWCWTMIYAGLASAQTAVVFHPNTDRVDLASRLIYWQDHQGDADWKQANEAASQGLFRPLPEGMADPNFGLTSSAYWFRLKVRSLVELETALIEVAYPPLDAVSFYINGQLRSLTGDHLAFSSRPYAHRHFVLPVKFTQEEAVLIDIRVVNAGNLTVPIRLWSRGGFERHNQVSYGLLAAYFGLMVGLAVYNLLLFLSLRSPSYLCYVLFILALGYGLWSYNGFQAQYVSPDWPAWNDRSPLVGFTLAGIFGILFVRTSLAIGEHLPTTNHWLLAFVLMFAVQCVCVSLGWSPIINRWIYLTGLGANVLLIFTTWQAMRKKITGAEVFMVAWGILALGIGTANLRNLGWIPNNLFTQNALQLSSALEMVLLSFALAHRIHSERRLREQAQAQALSLRLDLVHTLQHKEMELEALVQERTLKLQQAHEALSQRETEMRELAHHDGLTGLANRKLLEDRFHQATARAQRNGLELVVMVIDLDSFKPINDTHGHAAGDTLLKVLAQRMATRLRQTDTLARIGGDEFVVLLSDLPPDTCVNAITHSLEGVLSTAVMWCDIELHVSGSIGCARYPQDSLTLQHLLNEADRRMYEVKQLKKSRLLHIA